MSISDIQNILILNKIELWQEFTKIIRTSYKNNFDI